MNLNPSYFQSIREDLAEKRKDLIKSLNLKPQEEDQVRPVDDAALILDHLEKILLITQDYLQQHSYLKILFEKKFGQIELFQKEDHVHHILFSEDFLFIDNEECMFTVDENVEEGVLDAYVQEVKHWWEEAIQKHHESQKQIKESFSLSMQHKDLLCKCIECVADYRGKLREVIFKEITETILETYNYLTENFDSLSINEIASEYQHLNKVINKRTQSVKFRLKRSSLNRLENQIKEFTKRYFGYQTELGSKQVSKIKEFYSGLLKKQNLNRELIGDDEYNRFFTQLHSNLWRPEKYLEKEFSKLIKSVLAFKRKDISATILKDYLGQFWLHSRARRLKRKIVYHMGPTNSGKTYHALQRLCELPKGCYLAPLRLLASEQYDTMNSMGVKTTLLTGEEVVEIEDATHYSSTIEMAKFHEEFDCCVIDEVQMMSDSQRGWAWTRALINIEAKEVHLCGDASVYDLVEQIVGLTGDELEVQNYERMTQLKVESKPIRLGELQKNDALIVFSRRNALRYKADLEALDFKVSIVYGRLSPEVRREQARKFDQGETDIMVSTDAIAMGMNLPVKRIVFSTFSKFIDGNEYRLSHSEIKQISGRAGRFKRFPIGYVTSLSREENGINILNEALHSDLPQKTQAMVGPDLEIFDQVNSALTTSSLPILRLSEFLRLFNTMTFKKPFYCVDLKEMIDLAELVEQANEETNSLQSHEIFGFACAPVNLGLQEHIQYYMYILGRYVHNRPIRNEDIDPSSDNIDYLETTIKCVELFQWLARHFRNKNFEFEEEQLLANKGLAIEKLNDLLSDKLVRHCSSCGVKIDAKSPFNICESCFQKRRFRRPSAPGRGPNKSGGGRYKGKSSDNRKKTGTKKKSSRNNRRFSKSKVGKGSR